MTGLGGGYDFAIDFSTIGKVQGPAPDAANPGTGAPVDPMGALPLPDAARRRFGIRLDVFTRPCPVLQRLPRWRRIAAP